MGKEGNKPANGTPESSSNSQSGAGKKVQTLRAGFHSTKPRNAALITVHQSAVALQAADAFLREDPPPAAGSSVADKHGAAAQQQPVSSAA